MENYRKSAHCTYDIKYHLVWITKYRKPILLGKIGVRTRELIRMVCQNNEVQILAGHVGSDHIHLLVSVPPHLSASKLVQYIRGNTSRKLQMEYKELNKEFWDNICGQEDILWQAVEMLQMKLSENIYKTKIYRKEITRITWR